MKLWVAMPDMTESQQKKIKFTMSNQNKFSFRLENTKIYLLRLCIQKMHFYQK